MAHVPVTRLDLLVFLRPFEQLTLAADLVRRQLSPRRAYIGRKLLVAADYISRACRRVE